MKNRRYLIVLMLFTILVVNYMDRVALSVAAKSISTHFDLSPVQMGYLFSSFLWTYVICLIPVGMIVDRFGVKMIVGGGLLLWSVATAFTGLSWSFTTLLIGRLLMGAGESTSYPGGARAIRDWIPESERGIITTFFNSGSVAGPAIGSLLVGLMMSVFGWQATFVVLGVVGILVLVPWMIWYSAPESASWLPAQERQMILDERHGRNLEPVNSDTKQSSLGYLLSSKATWGLMLSQACIVYSIYLFLTWLPSYLQATLQLDVLQTGKLTAVCYGLTIICGIAVAWMSDRMLSSDAVRAGGRRYFVAALMLVGLVVLAAPMVTGAPALVAIIVIVMTATNTASAFNQTMANDLVENPRDVSRIMSFTAFGGNLCGIFAPIVTGYVVNATGGYDWAFRIAAFLLVAGAVVALLLSSGRIRSQHASDVNITPAMDEHRRLATSL